MRIHVEKHKKSGHTTLVPRPSHGMTFHAQDSVEGILLVGKSQNVKEILTSWCSMTKGHVQFDRVEITGQMLKAQ